MPVQEFDTTTLFEQLQDQISANIELIQRALDETEAVYLQKQIDEMQQEMGTTDISDVGDGTVKGAVSDVKDSIETIRSHIGMIIHSTTLDTEEKVKNIYGGESWTRIEGRFLLGCGTDYAVNEAGGSAVTTLSVENIPKHTHTGANHAHSVNAFSANNSGAHYHIQSVANNGAGSGYGISSAQNSYGYLESNNITSTAGAHSHVIPAHNTNAAAGTTGATGSGSSFSNMPPYKVVYIWERTA